MGLIMILCFFSFKNRSTHKVFKESRCVYFGSFFSLFVFLVVVIFNLSVDDISIIITIQSGAMLITIGVIWCLFYGIRMYQFFKFPDKRSSVIITAIKTKNTKISNQIQTKMTNKQSAEVPNYVNELYKQRGFESKATPNTSEKENTAGGAVEIIAAPEQNGEFAE